MDQIRQIRYLIAPFFFYGSIIFGMWNQDRCWVPKPFDSGTAAILIPAIIPVGFLLNLVSRAVLSRWIEYFKFRNPETLDEIHRKLAVVKSMQELDSLHKPSGNVGWYLQAAFDHGFIDKGSHEWILRSWSGFFVSADSGFGLILAFFVGALLFDVDPTWLWVVGTFGITCLLFWNAKNCRQRCIDMIELQAWRGIDPKRTDPAIRSQT
jgi:hypothetical protein